MPIIHGNIKIVYEIDDIEDLIGPDVPESTQIEKGNHGDEFVLSKHWTIGKDQLVSDAREQLAENHSTLKAHWDDADISVEDETIVIAVYVE